MQIKYKAIVTVLLVYALLCRVSSVANAAAVEQQRCKQGSECKIGEFLYDDNYDPVTEVGICTITSKDPSGSAYAAPPSPMSTTGDGWYTSSWTVGGSQTEGIYPTQVCCTPTGEGKVCMDKTFVIGPTQLSAIEVQNAVWDAAVVDHGVVGSFSDFLGDLTANIWAYTTRSLTTAALSVGQLAIKSEVESALTNAQNAITGQATTNTSTITGAITTAQNAITSNANSNVTTLTDAITAAQNSIKGASNKDLTQINTSLVTLQTTANTISSNITTLQTSVDGIATDVDTLVTKWGSYDAAQLITEVQTIQTRIGTSADVCATTTVFGQIKCVKDKWGSTDADTIFTAANNAYSTATALRNELNYNGKSTTAYEDLQNLIAQLNSVDGSITTAQTTITDAITASETAINALANSNADAISADITAAQTAINAHSDSNTGTITDAITAAQNAINSQATTNTGTITGAITDAQTALSGQATTNTSTITGAISSAQSAITGQATTNTNTITGAISTAQGAINTQAGTNTSTITAAITAAQNSIKGASNRDLTQVTTDIAGVQTTANSIVTKVDNLQTSVNTISTNVTTLINKWGSYDADQLNTQIINIQDSLGTTSDTCSDTTVFGYVQCIKDKWGAQTAATIYTAANNAYTTASALRSELAYNGKSTTAYEDIQSLLSQISAVDGSVSTAQSTITAAISASQTAINTQAATNTGTITSAITSAQNNINSQAATNTGTITSAVSASEGTVTSAISSAQSALASGATTNTNTITGAITSAQNNINTQASTNTGTITSAITSAQNNINSQATTNTGTITSAISDAQTAINANSDANTTTLTSAISAAQTALSTQATTNTSTITTAISNVQTTANSIASSISTLQSSVNGISTNVDTLVTNWSSMDTGAIITEIQEVQTSLGTNGDLCATSTVFGQIKCVKDKWGSRDADALYTAANNAYSTATALRSELNYNGKSTTAYEDLQNLITQLNTVDTSISTAQGTITSAITAAEASIKGLSDRDLTQLSTQVTGLQTSVDSISTKIDNLETSVNGMSTDINNLITEWNNSSVADVLTEVQSIASDLGTSSDNCAASTVFGYVQCIKDKWGAQDAASIYTAANTASTIATALRNELNYNGKSTTAYQDLQSLQSTVVTINSLIGTSGDSAATNTVFGRIKKAQDRIDVLNTSSTDLTGIIEKWGTYNAADLYNEIVDISNQIDDINTVSDVNSILKLEKTSASDMLALKNQVLGLSALVDINKTMLDKISNGPIIKTWLEEGSIIFKTLITNPSSTTSQTVPIKVYLPKEATQKDIIKTDAGLTIQYSAEDGALFATGEFTLKPNETKIVAVELTDIWRISEDEIASLKTQAQDLSEPLKNTSYFAQSVTIKSDIVSKLDSVLRTQNDAVTPDQRISAYRNNVTQIEAVKSELEDLKGLLSQSSSSGNLLGFIGGSQAISVWVIVLVLLVSFVFMVIYMRMSVQKLKSAKKEPKSMNMISEIQEEKTVPVAPLPNKFNFKVNKKILAIIGLSLVGLSLMGTGIYFLLSNKPKDAPKNLETVTQEKTQEEKFKEMLQNQAKESTPSVEVKKNLVTIQIPSYSDGVNIRTQPTVDSPVKLRITKDTEVEKFSDSGDWVEVSIPNSADHGFVLKSLTTSNEKPEPKNTQKVTLLVPEDVDGVNVRAEASLNALIITKLTKSKEYNVLDKNADWTQITIDSITLNGTTYTKGWVNNKYIK